MTREEEIYNIANTISPDVGKEIDENYICADIYDFTIGFACGAKWADKTMLEKACEWLLHQEEMIGISFEDDFIERFKKSMEE